MLKGSFKRTFAVILCIAVIITQYTIMFADGEDTPHEENTSSEESSSATGESNNEDSSTSQSPEASNPSPIEGEENSIQGGDPVSTPAAATETPIVIEINTGDGEGEDLNPTDENGIQNEVVQTVNGEDTQNEQTTNNQTLSTNPSTNNGNMDNRSNSDSSNGSESSNNGDSINGITVAPSPNLIDSSASINANEIINVPSDNSDENDKDEDNQDEEAENDKGEESEEIVEETENIEKVLQDTDVILEMKLMSIVNQKGMRLKSTNENTSESVGSYEINENGVLVKYKSNENNSIFIPDTVKEIGERVFRDHSEITLAVIPNSVTSIGDYSFFNTGIVNITVPDSVTHIEGCAFSRCENMHELHLSNSIISIGDWVFRDCSSLKNIYYNGTLEQWEELVHYNDYSMIGAYHWSHDEFTGTSTFFEATFKGCPDFVVHFNDGTEKTYHLDGNNPTSNVGEDSYDETDNDISKGSENKSSNTSADSSNSNNDNDSPKSTNTSASDSVPFDAEIYNKTEGRYSYNSAGYIMGQYTDAGHFLDDLTGWEGFTYNISNRWRMIKAIASEKWKSTFTPGYNTSADAIAREYMNDPIASKAILADIIEEMCQNEKQSYSTIETAASDVKKTAALAQSAGKYGAYLYFAEMYSEDELKANGSALDKLCKKTAEESFKNTGYSKGVGAVSSMAALLKTVLATDADLQNMLIDYEQNIAFLEGIEENTQSDSALGKAVTELKKEYENSIADTLADVGHQILSMVKEFKELKGESGSSRISATDITGIIVEDDKFVETGKLMAKTLLGKGYGNGSFLWDVAIKLTSGKSIEEADKVIMSASMRNNAIIALNKAEAEYLADRSNIEKNKTFVNSFKLLKSLTMTQYKNMYSYYSRNGMNNKATEIKTKMDALNAFTPAYYLVNIGKIKGNLWENEGLK